MIEAFNSSACLEDLERRSLQNVARLWCGKRKNQEGRKEHSGILCSFKPSTYMPEEGLSLWIESNDILGRQSCRRWWQIKKMLSFHEQRLGLVFLRVIKPWHFGCPSHVHMTQVVFSINGSPLIEKICTVLCYVWISLDTRKMYNPDFYCLSEDISSSISFVKNNHNQDLTCQKINQG